MYVEETLLIITKSTIDKDNGVHRLGRRKKKLVVEEQEEEKTMILHVKAVTVATLTPKPHVNILRNVQTN